MNTITEGIVEREEEHLIIAGDLNARTEEEGGSIEGEEEAKNRKKIQR